jgi:hypothetical protein
MSKSVRRGRGTKSLIIARGCVLYLSLYSIDESKFMKNERSISPIEGETKKKRKKKPK